MTSDAIKVLLMEDNPGDAEWMTRAMAKASTRFEVDRVTRLSDALTKLKGNHYDIILADLSLPDSDGLETVVKIQSDACHVLMIVLTGLASDEVALASLDQGAQDYLVKDRVTSEVLDRAIRHAIGPKQNAEMRRLLAQLEASEELLEKKNRRLARLYKMAHRFVDNVSHEFRTPL